MLVECGAPWATVAPFPTCIRAGESTNAARLGPNVIALIDEWFEM